MNKTPNCNCGSVVDAGWHKISCPLNHNFITKEQVDQLPDMSATIASMGRGSMQRRIEQLEKALHLARYTLSKIDEIGDNGYAASALEDIAEMMRG